MNNKKQIYIINGSGGKGKNTFVELLSQYIDIFEISSIDIIRKISLELGWDGKSKTEKDRKFWSDLKMLSTEYSNHSYNYIKNKIKEFIKNIYINIMFIHIREPLEINKIKNEFNCKTILIKNHKIKDITSNIGEKYVYNYKYDFIINNSENLNNLKLEAIKFYVDNIKFI